MKGVDPHVVTNSLVPIELVWKVARYTSAAPFYFRELDNYVDGGVRANNPCQHALRIIQMHLRSQRR